MANRWFLNIFVFVFTCISFISCSEYDVPIANFVGVVCKDSKAEIRFDAEPTDVYIEYRQAQSINHHGYIERIGDWGSPSKWEKWEIVDNKIIMECPEPFIPNFVVGPINVRWGKAPNDQSKEFGCPCQ